ncbi:MAG: NAD(P) transhydrogenase subunit alpha [Actinobacteria bacterium]|nr:NAD(P) transhydrogenase subunit alpha [Actinomycetota bacterium]
MTGSILNLVTVFVLAGFLGFEVISKVPSILHTPLMSGTNAIHGVILVGAIIVTGTAHGTTQLSLGFATIVLATLNVVGGFVVTDRMLEMFKSRSKQLTESGAPGQSQPSGPKGEDA